MKLLFRIFICLYILVASGLYAETGQQQPQKTSNDGTVVVDKSSGRQVFILPGQFIVASKGETVVEAKSVNLKVRVVIRTHELQIGKPSDKIPGVIRSNCTYSRYPCSPVDYIDIFVNNNPIIFPRSVFCDLADLNTAEIKIGQKDMVLTLVGGDASASYIVKIEFDAKHVKRTLTFSGEFPDEPLQETTYYMRILGD